MIVLSNFALGIVLKIFCLLQSRPNSEDDFGSDQHPLLLTPYIDSGNYLEGQRLSRVSEPFFGLQSKDMVESYSGFLTVNKSFNRNIFFWFFPALETDSRSAPVVIWLQGGPGSSSLFGQFELHGPYAAVANECGQVKVRRNPNTWVKKANVIYIDNPVGVGFSFGNNLTSSAATMTDELYSAIVQWLHLFPAFQSNPIYIFGESYGAKFAIQVATKIHNENYFGALKSTTIAAQKRLKIHLTGIGLGNGWISPIDSTFYAQFLYDSGKINEAAYHEIKQKEAALRSGFGVDWHWSHKLWLEVLYTILSGYGCNSLYNVIKCNMTEQDYDYEKLVNYRSSKRSLHAENVYFSDHSNVVQNSLKGEMMKSELDNLEALLEHYKVMIYNGNLDVACNTPATLNIFPAMKKWSGRKEFLQQEQQPLVLNNKPVGFIKSARNLIFAGINDAGHMVPKDQPETSLALLEKFLNGTL